MKTNQKTKTTHNVPKDGTSVTVVTKGSTTKLKGVTGYTQVGDAFCLVEDNGNGFLVKFMSDSCCMQDIYMSLDYAQAEDLRLCLNNIDKHNNLFSKGINNDYCKYH